MVKKVLSKKKSPKHGYIGVCKLSKGNTPFRSYVTLKTGSKKTFGFFKNALEASKARLKFIKEYPELVAVKKVSKRKPQRSLKKDVRKMFKKRVPSRRKVTPKTSTKKKVTPKSSSKRKEAPGKKLVLKTPKLRRSKRTRKRATKRKTSKTSLKSKAPQKVVKKKVTKTKVKRKTPKKSAKAVKKTTAKTVKKSLKKKTSRKAMAKTTQVQKQATKKATERKFKGVTRYTSRPSQQYRSYVRMKNGRHKTFGYHDTPEQAFAVRQKWILENPSLM